MSSFSDFVASDVGWARFSLVFTLNGTVGVTNTWLANVDYWDWSDWVLDFVVFTVSASASFVLATAFVRNKSFTTTWLTFLVLTFEFHQTALGSVTNARLFAATFVQSFGFWFVTGGAESVWVVFWMSFVTVDSFASLFFTSVVLTASGGQVGNVNEFFTFSASVILVKTAALSEGSDVFASGNTFGVTTAWHANVVVLVPFVSDWVFLFVVNTSGYWWNTLFGWATAFGVVWNEFDGTANHARWVNDEEWALRFTLTSVDFATVFGVNVLAGIKFFLFRAYWY